MAFGPHNSKRKYEYLLKDKDVQRWFDNVARGSLITATVYLRRLGSYCESHKTDPKRLLTHSNSELKKLLLDLVSELEKKKYAGSYVGSNVKALKSWFSHNDIEVSGRIRISGESEAPTLREEKSPDQSELHSVFLAATLQQRSADVIIAHCGFRLETLGDFEGDDGLVISDFPEMELKKDRVIFRKVPTMVVVRPTLSKAGHQYFSFLTPEGCEYVKQYLESRIRSGES